MVNRLFDLAQDDGLVTINQSDGPDDPWTIGYDLQSATAASALLVGDPCSETSTLVAGMAYPLYSPAVYTITSFAANVSARRNNRCANGEELEMVLGLLENGGLTSAAEYALWNGLPAWNPAVAPSLMNTDVLGATIAGTVPDTLANVINKYSAATALQPNLIHLGIKAAMDLSALGYVYAADAAGNLRVRATGAPVVVSPYYPIAGVALTGPIEIRLEKDPAAYQVYDYALNRTNISGYQLMAIGFDPSTSVRAQ